MVDLDDLPVSDAARAAARAWSVRWDQLVSAQLHSDWAAAGKWDGVAAPVSDEQWDLLERDGRDLCKRLQDELGRSWLLEWAEGS